MRVPSIGRILIIGCVLVGLALAAGCGQAAAGASTDASPAPSPTRWPAAMAGGSCQLLDYDTIAATLGLSFDVAASSQAGATYTCVLEKVGAALPDLSLSVTPTQATATIFASMVAPPGSVVVPKLGKRGYSATVGGAAEVGWLSANQRLIVLRVRPAAGGPAALLPRLVALARKIDSTSS